MGLGAATLLGAVLGWAEPVPLGDDQLAALSAGRYLFALPPSVGGAVVGGHSALQSRQSSTLELSGSVQQTAVGLHINNSVASSVGNAANVLAQALQTSAVVVQANRVTQFAGQPATLDGWHRAAGSRRQSSSESVHADYRGGIVPATFSFSGTVVRTESSTPASDGDGETITTSAQSLEIGLGAAAAGSLRVDGSAGSVGFSENYTVDTLTTTTTSVTVGFWRFRYTVKENTQVHIIEQGDIAGSVELPTYQAVATGVSCLITLGSCSGAGDYTRASTSISESLGAVTLGTGEGGLMVLDQGSARSDNQVEILLRDHAQENSRALGISNAVSANIANGVNVAVSGSNAQPAGSVGVRQSNHLLQRTSSRSLP